MGVSLRIIRQRIYHQGTFESILRAVRSAQRCQRIAGRYWIQVYRSGGVRIYRPATYDLAWIQERVEEYERFFYSSLASGYCDRDGLLRSRTRNMHHGPGGYRQSVL
jgi:hypothetical protein